MPLKPTPLAEDAATRIARALSDDRKEYEAGMKLVPYSRARAAAVIRDMLAKEFPPKARKKAKGEPKAPRERDPIFDAIAAVCGADINGLTERYATTLGVARAQIVGATPTVTPAEIKARAAVFKKKYRDVSLTPMGLSGRWPELWSGKAATEPAPEMDVYREPANWQSALRNIAKTRGWGEDAIDETCALPWEDVSLTIRQEIIKALNS